MIFNLSHPNIVQVLGICRHTGLIASEYIATAAVKRKGLTVIISAGSLRQVRR